MIRASTLRFSVLAFALVAPIVACNTASDPPKVVDLSSEIKKPAGPGEATVKAKAP